MALIPKYARNADRRKLVRIFCKGYCKTTRWAEMNVDFPGNRALRNSKFGKFTARCLKCGKEAKDSYNWFR